MRSASRVAAEERSFAIATGIGLACYTILCPLALLFSVEGSPTRKSCQVSQRLWGDRRVRSSSEMDSEQQDPGSALLCGRFRGGLFDHAEILRFCLAVR